MPGLQPFDVIPAIDLLRGRVVRLAKGDFGRATAYSDDPVAVAQRFAEEGARWVHVVDLDGARTGEPAHLTVLGRIAESVTSVSCEAAGGLRTAAAIDDALAAGARRVVLGTAALRAPDFAGDLVARLGADRVASAIDVRNGRAVGDAWAGDAGGIAPDAAVAMLADVGVRIFEVTAVERDGLLAGPDLDLLERIVELDAGAVIGSGGIRSAADLVEVRNVGCAGAIVGRALYEGRFGLPEALDAVRA